MKKRGLLLLLVLTIAASVMACGKSKEEKELEEFANELGVEVDDLSEFEKALIEEEIAYQKEKEEKEKLEEQQQESIESFGLFDAVSEWANYKPEDAVIQIDDVFYVPGCTVEEIIQQVEDSAIEYSFEYNPDKLVTSKNKEVIKVMRDGIDWFSIETFNFTAETGSLKNNFVTAIVPTKDAYSCVRILDGRSVDEFIGLPYEEVLKFKGTIFNETSWLYAEKPGFGRDEEGNSYDTLVEEFTLIYPYVNQQLLRSGFDTQVSTYYSFIINSNTGVVENVNINFTMTSYQETEVTYYDALSEVKTEDMEAFIQVAEQTMINELGATELEGLKIYLEEYSGSKALFFSYKITKADGTEKYAYVELIRAGYKYIGGIGYKNIYWEERDISEGEYVVKTNLSRTYIDEMVFPSL